MADIIKRNTAFKLKVGNILAGKPILEENKLKSLDLNGKNIVRVNLIANVIDKYVQDGEKKFASLTLDDATGQIKVKLFGEDIEKISQLTQGDTILAIGLLKYWNNEVYITPEILKKKDPSYLLLRKLEVEKEQPKSLEREDLGKLKNKIIDMIKDSDKDGGVETEKLILELKEHPDIINSEVKKILEEGIAYEPRPGKIRYLG